MHQVYRRRLPTPAAGTGALAQANVTARSTLPASPVRTAWCGGVPPSGRGARARRGGLPGHGARELVEGADQGLRGDHTAELCGAVDLDGAVDEGGLLRRQPGVEDPQHALLRGRTHRQRRLGRAPTRPPATVSACSQASSCAPSGPLTARSGTMPPPGMIPATSAPPMVTLRTSGPSCPQLLGVSSTTGTAREPGGAASREAAAPRNRCARNCLRARKPTALGNPAEPGSQRGQHCCPVAPEPPDARSRMPLPELFCGRNCWVPESL